ncbi:MAG: TonB-dependent receptor [Maricaulaceae bacterium]|nr:TonB-dependent receptor [Maricaulaceae bacterium]
MRIALAPLLLLFAGAAPAAAQEVITVTAARRAEARDAAAVPVAIIPEAEVERTGAQHPSELLNRAPGVMIHRNSGAEHLTAIRSPVLTGGAGAGSFLFLEDGVPLRAAGFANVNGLFEGLSEFAAGVEIIRGPGTALHGSNALHGLVNVLTPDPAQARSLTEAEIASFGRWRGRAIAARQGDGLNAYAALSWLHEDGWRDNAGLDRIGALTGISGRAGRFDWRAGAGFVWLDQNTATFITGQDAYRDRARSRSNPAPDAFRKAWAARAFLRAETALDNGWSLSLTPYARVNEMELLMHFLPSQALEETGHHSLGLQAQVWREGARGSVTLGADAEWTRGFLVETQELPSFGQFPEGVHYDFTADAWVIGGYVQGRWKVNDAVSLEAGLRVEGAWYDYENHRDANAIGRFLRPESRRDDFTVVTPHFGAVWTLNTDQRLFLRAARGARAPQAQELYRLQPGQQIDGINPEVLDSLEAGWRWTGAGGARVEIAAFAMEKRNVFFRDADGLNVTDARTRHRGVEVEAAAPLHDTLLLSLSATLARHQYAYDRPVSQAWESVSKGDDIDTAPRVLGNLRLLWTPDARLTVEAEWAHVGRYYTDAANDHTYPGHDVANLRAVWRGGERWEVFGVVRNLFDVRYAERADFAFGTPRYFPGEPRAFSAGFRLRG